MVHWVYVLECDNGYIYVGETTRLFRRFKEHQQGGGAVNTHMHSPERLIGLYKVADNSSFLEYRRTIRNNVYDPEIIITWGEDDSSNLDIENHFTEMYMYQRTKMEDDDFIYTDGQWQKVKGGKYTKYIRDNPILSIDSESIIDRPNCNCQVPSEVKISKDKNTIYFVCSLKNVWDDFYKYLEIDTPCDFYKIYSDDNILKAEYKIAKKKISEQWCSRIPFTKSIIFPDPCILCKTPEYKPHYYWYNYRRVCQACILNRYDELKNEYSFSACMIND